VRPRVSRLFAGLVVVVLAVAFLPLAAGEVHAWAADLLFSEYIEGSSNNKALEIYNATGAAVDLGAGGYSIQQYSNGSATASVTINLTGTIANGDVYVVAHSSANATILAQADQTSGAGLFNGNDALVLRKGTTFLDVIGQVGVDPGTEWGTGLTSTANNTLRRKAAVCAGDPDGSNAFDPSIEWDGYAEDTFSGLGAHTSDCLVPPAPADPKINEFSASTTGTDVEYVEVYGDPSSDYSAYTVLEIEGDFSGTQTGKVDEVIAVGTTDAGGFYLANLAANALENGTITLLLVRDFTGALDNDLDTNDDGVLDITPWSALVDAVAVGDGGSSDLTYGVPVLASGYDGVASTPGGASRIPDGTDTDTAADWVRNDFDLAGIPPNAGTPVLGEAFNTPGATNQVVTAVDPKINEFVADHTGTDTSEYIEVFGSGGVDYSSYTVLQIEGDGTGAGVIDTAWVVGTTTAGGFWHTGFLNNVIENGTLTLLLVRGFSGAVGNDLDTDDDGALDSSPWSAVVDAVALTDGGGSDRVYGAPLLAVGTDGASRLPDGLDTDAPADWMPNDFDLAGIPGYAGTPVLGEALNTPNASNQAYTPPAADPKINEFSASTTGTDVEYVEVYGDPSSDYSAYTVLEIEGDFSGTQTGKVDEVIAVGTTDAGGFYLANLAANALENGTITLLLVRDFTGALDNDLDTNDDGVLDITPWSALVDAVAVGDGGSSDLTYGVPVLASGYDGVASTPGGASRIPDGTDTDTAADWVRNDFDLAGIPPNAGTPVLGEAFNTPGATNQAYTPPPEACGDAYTPIYQVQGPGSASPLVGAEVAVEGIVVGDFQDGGKGGYYLQDATGDGDPATSDGIFIYAPGGAAVGPGDRVRVRGHVSEYFGLTEITPGTVWICSAGNPLPAPAPLTLPVASLDAFEPYEGMRVTFPQPLYISEFFDFDRYGEIVLTSNVQYTPTAVVEPGAAATALAAANALDRITLDDGRTSQNPDPAIHPNGLAFDLANRFRGGDTVTDVTGVLDYSFDKYRVQPTQGGTYTATNPRPVNPPAVGGTLKVASFNVLNYFTTLNSRGANTAEEFDRQRAKIIAALSAINADVVGLIEIENNAAAIADLVAGLNAAMGAGTYAYIDTGVIGIDEIKVALIYRPATVTPRGAHAVLTSAVDPRFIDTKNRPVLAQTFEAVDGSGIFTVAVNHLKSKGSDCNDVGDPDLGDGAGNCNLTRTAAAEALVGWLATDPTGSGDEDFLIIGDLNSYDKEDPIDVLRAGGYTDLLDYFGGEYAYSYLFDGQFGYLDYALAGSGLMGEVTGAAAWHINADEPDLLDYDMTFKQPAQDALYEPNAFRSSDHDAVIVGLTLDAVPPVVQAMPDLVLEATGPLGAVATWVDPSAMDAVDGPRPVSCIPASGSTFPLGVTPVVCSASDNAGNIGSASFTVTVRDTTPPMVTVPGPMTVEATSPFGRFVVFSASAVDMVSGPRPVTCLPASGSLFPLGVTAVTCSAVDLLGNVGSASFTVTVGDTTGPVVTVPGPMTVEASGPSGAAVNFPAWAVDAVDGPRPVTCLPASGSLFPLGVTAVVCSASDNAGNIGSASFTVTVGDTTGPVVTVPGPMTVEASGPLGAVATWVDPSAVDAIDGPRPVTCLPASGSLFPLGVTPVVCSASDNAGNIGSASFTVTVRDTTPPMVTVPGPMTVEATSPFGRFVVFSASAVDMVSGPRPVTCLPASGSLFPLGVTAVTCSAVDLLGNVGSASFTVTVGDTTPPVITLLGAAHLVVAAGSTYLDAGAAAFDLVDGDLTGAVQVVSSVDTSSPGTYAVTYDVVDSHGNHALQVVRQVRVAYFCAGEEATLWGTPQADVLIGTSARDVITGLGGDDFIRGLGGDDLICAGPGDDFIRGDHGDDVIYAGAGDDWISGGSGDDWVSGGAGHDVVAYHDAFGPVTVRLLAGTATGEGSDVLRRIEEVIGSRFGDVLVGGPIANVLRGGLGDDVIRGGGAADVLWGGPGDDHIYGNGGDDFLWGGRGDDLLVGGLGHDTLDGVPE